MKCRYLSPVVVVLVLSVAVRAAEPVTNRLSEVVVSATRIPSETENTSTAVTVLQGDELERRQVRTVSEALREVPGLNVVQNGQPGGIASVFVRGANANHTLVLIDGVRANNGYDSRFDFASMPMDNVERIEILRGPQSTLYGSEALGGVINIVTRHGADKPTGAVTFEAGSHDSIRPRANFATTYGKLSLSAAGSYFSTDNDRINNALRQEDFNGSIRYQLLEHLTATVSGWYRSSHAGSPNGDTGWGANDPDDFINDENTAITAALHAQPFEVWDARLTFSHNHIRRYWNGPDPSYPYYSWDTTDRDQVDFQNLFLISDHHKLVAGMSFDNIHANQDVDYGFGPSLALSKTTRNYSGYGQYEFTPIPRATLNAGLRIDSYNTFGAEMTYRFGARYTVPVTETILRANFGTGFRAPSFLDQYYPYPVAPNLQPERSIGWDAGFEQPLFDNKLRIGANYFQNEFNNLIQYAVVTMVNVQQAQTIGVESFASWTPVKELLLRGSYTWLPTVEDQITNKRLANRPRHSGDLLANYRFLQRFDATLHAQLAAARQDYGLIVKTGSFLRLDAGLSYEVCKNFTVFGRIENLTDAKYNEVAGYPGLGRTVWGGGTVKF